MIEWYKNCSVKLDLMEHTRKEVMLKELDGRLMIGLEVLRIDCVAEYSVGGEYLGGPQLSITTLLKIKRVWEECLEINS